MNPRKESRGPSLSVEPSTSSWYSICDARTSELLKAVSWAFMTQDMLQCTFNHSSWRDNSMSLGLGDALLQGQGSGHSA